MQADVHSIFHPHKQVSEIFPTTETDNQTDRHRDRDNPIQRGGKHLNGTQVANRLLPVRHMHVCSSVNWLVIIVSCFTLVPFIRFRR